MAIFDAINAAGSGMVTSRVWLDAIADNVANINTVQPTSGKAFQAEFVQAQALPTTDGAVGGGVEVTGIPLGNATGRVTYDPQSPMADRQGNVRMPDIDMGEQMGNLIMAQRSFQANAAVVDRARDSYQAAIDLGKGAGA